MVLCLHTSIHSRESPVDTNQWFTKVNKEINKKSINYKKIWQTDEACMPAMSALTFVFVSGPGVALPRV